MISHIELDHILKIAETDPGMADMLTRTKEYYLLKRTSAPAVPRTFDMSQLWEEYEAKVSNKDYLWADK